MLRVVGGLLLLTSGLLCQDPCSPTHHSVIDEPKRNKNYHAPADSTFLCDHNLSPGWYVFKDAIIPTSCVQRSSCGTHIPIWMQGNLPRQSDGIVSRSGCLNLGSCCEENINLLVKNCGSFVAYFLWPTKGCSVGYCTEGGTPTNCPPGEELIFGVCAEKYPAVTTHPRLIGPEIHDGSFRFACRLPNSPSKPGSNFQVTWSFDGYEDPNIPKTVLRGNNKVAYLNERYWYRNIGKTLTCQIRSYFDRSPQKKSDPYESNGYWGGIKVTPSKVMLSEAGTNETVKLTSTLPLLCHADAHRCQLGMEFGNTDDIVGVHACTAAIGRGNWDPVSKTTSVSFNVLALRDMRKDGNKKFAIHITIPRNYDVEHIWNSYTVPPIQVETIDKNPSLCSATGDPHITTFDRSGPYHLYKVGEFQFVKTVGKIPFEVQARTWTCVHKNSRDIRMCICGIVAREGNDIVKVDVCQSKLHHTWPKTEVLSGDLMHGTRVIQQKDGKQIMILFNSGAYVKCKIYWYGILLEVKSAPEHQLKTLGICGTIDGDKTNDLMMPNGTLYTPSSNKPNPFFETWRIPRGESLFDKVPPSNPKYNHTPNYCVCHNSTGKLMTFSCSKNKNIKDPQTQHLLTRWTDITQQLLLKNKSHRSFGPGADTDGYESYTFDYGDANYEAPDLSWPTTSGITEAAARELCMKSVSGSKLYATFQHEAGIALNETIDGCMEDILVSDGLDFVSSAADMFGAHCEFEAYQDVYRYTRNKEGELVPPAILTDQCPNNCNNKGLCNAGVCTCKHGYDGDDCSISSNEPPVLWEITRNGLCDFRKQACRTVLLLVDNLMPSEHLMCRLAHTDFNIHSGPTGRKDAYHNVKGTFIGYRQVSCPLPDTNGKATQAFSISVTNNGVHHSKDGAFLTYDSVCLNCRANMCTQKVNTCLIENNCYSPGELSPSEKNKVCDPTQSKSSWTQRISDAPLGGKVLPQWDIWTKKKTGCPCPKTASNLSCACCQPGGIQCGGQHKNQCVRDGDLASCGTLKPSPDKGVDGWTSWFSDCVCKTDQTQNSCACCNDGGCQCGANHKNQCVQCGHLETCGGKPEIFGPAFSVHGH